MTQKITFGRAEIDAQALPGRYVFYRHKAGHRLSGDQLILDVFVSDACVRSGAKLQVTNSRHIVFKLYLSLNFNFKK